MDGLDILVNNVSALALFPGDDEAAWQSSLNVDLMATVRATSKVVPWLAEDGDGNIVHISSTSGLEAGSPVAYAAAKAALVSHSKTMSVALAEQKFGRGWWSAQGDCLVGVVVLLRFPLVRSSLQAFPSWRWAMDYRERITIEPDKRGGKPCIRGMRITVHDVLSYLASGMTEAEILDDFPNLESGDIRAALAFAADFEHRLMAVPSV